MAETTPCKLALTPLDQSKKIADLEDDESLVLMLIGPKHYITAFATTIATMGEEWTDTMSLGECLPEDSAEPSAD